VEAELPGTGSHDHNDETNAPIQPNPTSLHANGKIARVTRNGRRMLRDARRPPIRVIPPGGQAIQGRIGAFVKSPRRAPCILLGKQHYRWCFAFALAHVQIAGARGPDLRVGVSILVFASSWITKGVAVLTDSQTAALAADARRCQADLDMLVGQASSPEPSCETIRG
jgi:hypothetical protein